MISITRIGPISGKVWGMPPPQYTLMALISFVACKTHPHSFDKNFQIHTTDTLLTMVGIKSDCLDLTIPPPQAGRSMSIG